MVFGSLGRSANNVMIHIKGDSKSLDSAVNSSDRRLGSFASKAKAYGPMIGAAFAGAAVGFIAMSVKMAAAEEAVSRQTEALLKSQGIMWKNVSGDLNAYMKDLEELTAYNDTDLQMAFNAMIAAGMSYTQAMESMNTVTSMSFSLNRDLQGMALLVGKAYNGQTGELSRYGIVLDETLDKTEKFAGLQKYVSDNFADASARTDTLEGQMAALKNETSNFAEALGAELLPDLTDFVRLLVEGSDASESFATKLGKLIALPFKEVTKAKTVEKLAIELHELEMIQKRTAEEERRRTEIIFEMQQRIAGTWAEYEASRISANQTMTDAEWEKAAAIYQGLGYSREYLDTLRNQTAETKKQTAEMEKQDKYIKSWGMKAAKKGITSADLAGLSGTSAAYAAGEAYTRQSGGATITFAGTRSGI